ncbi:MAG: S24 family peptidase, partial [Alphaproteobacteria bacterium]
FRRSWIRSIAPSSPNNLVVLQVDGDSMYPTLAHGDHVLVDSGQAQNLRDGIYVIRTQDSLQVKRISVNPATRRITVKSDNPAYDSWPDCDPGDLTIIGRVAWVGRRL